MPSTNLDFNVTAKTGQARADLKLLQEELNNVGRQLRAAVRAGDTAGARALADSFGVMQTQLVGLKRELNATEGAMIGLDRSMGLTARSFRSLHGAILGIGKALGGAQAGLVAFAAFTGLEALIKNLDAVDERLRKIRDTAREVGQKPLTIQAGQEIAGEAGGKPEDADKMFTAFGAAVEKAQTAAGAAVGPVQVLRGSMNEAGKEAQNLGSQFVGSVAVLRGGAPITLDLAKAYTTLGVKLTDIDGKRKTMQEGFIKAGKAFLAQKNNFSPEQLNALSKALFQVPAKTALEQLPDQITKIQQKITELNNSERGATDARLAQIKELDTERSGLLAAWMELDAKLANSLRGNQIAATKWLTDILKGKADFEEAFKQGLAQWTFHLGDFDNWMKDTKAAFSTFWTDLGTDFANSMKLWEEALPDFSGWIERTKAAFSSMWADIVATAKSAAAAIAGAGGGAGATAAQPFASGGYIRGPGSGTSDSILARLSNGEFVMRAAAVDRWGPQFMMALNNLRNPFGYAGGGLVRTPRFAAGGMVTATTADGVTVNLNFPGSSFALRGDREIVGGLTREARRAGMLSAGRMAGALA